jgi:hypothetical protein
MKVTLEFSDHKNVYTKEVEWPFPFLPNTGDSFDLSSFFDDYDESDACVASFSSVWNALFIAWNKAGVTIALENEWERHDRLKRELCNRMLNRI